MSTHTPLGTTELSSFYQLLSLLETHGDLPAVETSDLSLRYSYSELVLAIKQFALLLSAHVQPGDRIMLVDLHGPHWIIVFFATLLNKAIAVPIDHRMSAELQTEIQTLVGANMLITCKAETKTTLKSIVFEEQTLPRNTAWKEVNTNADSPAEVIFTSGTWGKPKGVTLSHNNILSNTAALLQTHQLKRGSTFLSVLPLSHAYEQVPGMLAPLASGSHIVYQTSLDSFSLLASMQQHRPDYMVVVPKFLDILQARIHSQTAKYKNVFQSLLHLSGHLPLFVRRLLFFPLHRRFGGRLKTFTIGGAPLSLELEQFFRSLGFKFIVGYGLSESSPVLTVHEAKSRPKDCVGSALPGVTIRIAQDGEILATGPNIFLGYWPLNPGTPTTLLYTGDLGHLDAHNRLFITGRKKNMVVFPTGDKIQLEDIELIAENLAGLVEACAMALEMEDGLPRLGLVYIGNAEPEHVLTQINSKLPLFGRLHFAKVWPEEKLPRSHLLKLQRKVIQEQYEAI